MLKLQLWPPRSEDAHMAGESVDLIAVGGGLAGLMAAGRALDLGKSALVLESEAEQKHLCASRVNGGVFHLGFRSVMADPAELAQIVIKATSGFVEPRLARALADNSARAVRWLQSAGVEFTGMKPDEGWKDRVLAPLGFHQSTAMTWKGLGADRMMDRLEAYLIAKGGTLLRGVRATGLVLDGGSCRGVVASGNRGKTVYHGRAVVLADGGFHGDSEMLRQFVTPHPEMLKLRGTASGRGDGIRFAQEAGAKLIGMEQFYGHLLSADSLSRDNLSPFPFLDFLALAGVIVDDRGERFVDEGRGEHALANTLARHRSALATVVFDEAMWNGAGRHFFCPPNPNLVDAGGTLHKANDLDSLARLAGLPAAALERTIEAHNATIAGGTLELLSPPRSAAKYKPQPFKTAPFYAAPACAAITHTMGGVAVDDRARVLRSDGRFIDGLYASGSTCGGLEGGPDFTYLGGLIKAAVFGMLAAEEQ